MNEFSWYVVCHDGCDPLGFATKENAETYRKEHECVNPHDAVVKPGSQVEA